MMKMSEENLEVPFEFGECHAHIFMDGKNYKKAVERHKNGVDESVIRSHFECYQKQGIHFVRDGGDALGVSRRAKELAPEYGIDYRTPIFAIHKNGHYGKIVGKGFDTLKEYTALVKEVKTQGGDFIKIMTTGIMDFDTDGGITGEALRAQEVKEMVHIAHEEGFAVMCHTNGTKAVEALIEAGADSVEHGNYMEEQTIKSLADSDLVWVPTVTVVPNMFGCGRFSDELLHKIYEKEKTNIKKGLQYGVKMALGSDAGAYLVFHGQGILDEYARFLECRKEIQEESQENEQEFLSVCELKARLKAGEAEIRKKFKKIEKSY